MKPAKYTDLCTAMEGSTSSLGGRSRSQGPNLDDNAHILVVVVVVVVVVTVVVVVVVLVVIAVVVIVVVVVVVIVIAVVVVVVIAVVVVVVVVIAIVVVVVIAIVVVVVVVVVIIVGSIALTFSVRHLILSSVIVARMGRGEAYTGFWWGNLRERDHLRDPGVDGRIISSWIFRKWDVGGMDRVDLAQDRGRWRTLVNTVTNLRVS